MAEPTCPSCGVAGIEHFASRESVERSRKNDPWFVVIYCNQCGYVHDIIAKHVFTQRQAPRFVLPKSS